MNKNQMNAVLAALIAAVIGFICPWTLLITGGITFAIIIGGKLGKINGLEALAMLVLSMIVTTGSAVGALLSLFF